MANFGGVILSGPTVKATMNGNQTDARFQLSIGGPKLRDLLSDGVLHVRRLRERTPPTARKGHYTNLSSEMRRPH